jgi:DNA-binding IclR family transcriptional regulator
MGYPQSSTSELLGCLVALGYLHRDRYARTYSPSARVALVGAWVQPAFFRKGCLLPMMDELVKEAGAPIVLASRVGLEVQHIHTVSPPGQRRGCQPVAARASLLHSPMGKALISTMDSERVRKLVHRLNAESDAELRVSAETLLEDLRQIRSQGYAVGAHDSAGGVVAILLPQASPEERLVLGIRGSLAEVGERTEEWVRLLRAAAARRLGPVQVTPPVQITTTEPVRRFA